MPSGLLKAGTSLGLAAVIASVSACMSDGSAFSLFYGTEGPPRETGPPRRSARDMMNAIEPALELVALHSFFFEAHIETPARAWSVRARRRDVPAQPSTRR